VDEDEPRRVALAVKELDLRHVVITSVTRDDLADGGAGHFAKVVREILALGQQTTVEVLTPDFCADADAVRRVADAGPLVFGHNVETVPRLYPWVRPGADYERSLGVLKEVKHCARNDMRTKSGLMVGLGETFDEILAVLRDLRRVGCDIVTVGQYLRPTTQSVPVAEFIPPKTFADLEEIAHKMGFTAAACGPFVRSSYLADRLISRR
jgi:lipoic acid synthetase